MCGIVGSVRFRGTVDAELLSRQRDRMEHRGPDSRGLWISPDGRVGLAHRRLAIIDLSPAGHQPMIDGETGAVITFNGEIYNYASLRDRLKAKGERFHTQSDTEVILAAYRVWGHDALNELDGMFAFALYDARKQEVLLARDRAGEKPLYIHRNADGLSFASEIKALLIDPCIPRRVRAASLNEYFAYGYVPGADTMFFDVKKLAPGSSLVVDMRSGTNHFHRYWTAPVVSRAIAEQRPSSIETSEFVETLHELLRTAVKQQLQADVPVGVLLSGGVDSSIVAAIAAEVSGTRIRTFTARFPGHGAFDEGPYARMVAQHLASEHVELDMPPASGDLLVSLIAQFDDPLADASMIPTYLVSREIRRHATVALGGDGGDELFGGYIKYPVQLQQEHLRRFLPRAVRRALGAVASRYVAPGVRGRSFALAIASEKGPGLSNSGRIFGEEERPWLSTALAQMTSAELLEPELGRQDVVSALSGVLQQSTHLDFSHFMVDDVLAKVDRASMLTSLEVRAPFLARSVIEFALSNLPDQLRATRSARKVILRLLGQRILPARLDLRRKQGFDVPLDDWMRGAWRPVLDGIAERHSSIIASNSIAAYRVKLEHGEPVGDRLFALLAFRLWEDEYAVTDVI